MKKVLFYFILVVASLHILSWGFAAITIRSFAPHETVHDKQDKGQLMRSPISALDTNKEVKANEEKGYKSSSKLGSRPPNCTQKCRGCKPCVAAQVPKTNGHLGVQYANYEPEGWVCKCGSSFFIP